MKIAAIITILLLLLIPPLYGYFYERHNLEVIHHRLNIGNNGKTIKIAHVTDLHTSKVTKLEKHLLEEIKKFSPDMIFITGDFITTSNDFSGYVKLLNEFKAPGGVYFVYGNWEHFAGEEYTDRILKKTNIIDLTNKKIKWDEHIELVGFDDHITGYADLSVLDKIESDTKKLALFHSPSFLEDLPKDVIDLGFAGHSHGGQVRWPFLGALKYPAGVGEYEMGWYEKNGNKMYVSRGIGTSILPIRINCRPELALMEITY